VTDKWTTRFAKLRLDGIPVEIANIIVAGEARLEKEIKRVGVMLIYRSYIRVSGPVVWEKYSVWLNENLPQNRLFYFNNAEEFIHALKSYLACVK
jgi:hypothetical protein